MDPNMYDAKILQIVNYAIDEAHAFGSAHVTTEFLMRGVLEFEPLAFTLLDPDQRVCKYFQIAFNKNRRARAVAEGSLNRERPKLDATARHMLEAVERERDPGSQSISLSVDLWMQFDRDSKAAPFAFTVTDIGDEDAEESLTKAISKYWPSPNASSLP